MAATLARCVAILPIYYSRGFWSLRKISVLASGQNPLLSDINMYIRLGYHPLQTSLGSGLSKSSMRRTASARDDDAVPLLESYVLAAEREYTLPVLGRGHAHENAYRRSAPGIVRCHIVGKEATTNSSPCRSPPALRNRLTRVSLGLQPPASKNTRALKPRVSWPPRSSTQSPLIRVANVSGSPGAA